MTSFAFTRTGVAVISQAVVILFMFVVSTGIPADVTTADEPVTQPAAQPGSFEALKSNFQLAPARLSEAKLPLKGLPLWHTNALITKEQIVEFFDQGEKNGFGGYTFLPLSKTTPKYLSEEYFQRFGEVLDEADKRGMKIIFYDDVDFPSGSAGGKMKTLFPEDVLKRLDKVEWTVTGPQEFVGQSSIPLVEKAVFGKPGGVLQAAVAMNTKTLERLDLAPFIKGNELKWSVPAGEWKLMLFICVADGRGLVDYMSPKAVKNFIGLTYDQFYKRFPDHFGTTIPLCFYDDITNTQTSGSRNWCLEFNQKYESMFGQPLGTDYPAVFYSIGEMTPVIRYRVWSVRNELFTDGYPKLVHQWCAEHGIQSSGHPQGPYVIQPNDMCGDAMLMHRNSDATLFDSIHYYGHGRDGFKIPTSAAWNFDQPICVVEIYGNYRNNQFDDTMLYRSAMEIFTRGGNLLLPHGIWSDPATMYIPPDISWRNPALKGCLPEYGKYVSRCSLLLQGGRHTADLGMVYPIDSLKAFFHFLKEWPTGDYPYGIYMPQETDYLATGAEFTTRIWRDFTILHPQTIDQKCTIESTVDTVSNSSKPVFRLNNKINWETYQTIVLTGADVISWSNLQKVLAFYRAGGTVLGTTHLPSRSSEGSFDDEVCAAIEEMFGIDPRTQAPIRAAKAGQEDITRSDNYDKIREMNAFAQYKPETKDTDSKAAVVYTDPVTGPKNAAGGLAIFVPRPTTDSLRTALDTLVPVPDVKIIQSADKPIPVLNVVPRWEYPLEGMFQYIHKIKDGQDVYYFANSSNGEASFDVQLRGTFERLEFWDPITGTTTSVPAERMTVDTKLGTTTVKAMTLPSISSIFIVGKKK